jgi:pyrroline-5-carboxylate reductase
MGSAIISGLVKAVGGEHVICHDSNPGALEKACGSYSAAAAASPEELCRRCDIIIVAVKPDAAPSVLREICPFTSGKVIVSIVAGLPLNSIEEITGSTQKVVRVMPNTPALVGEGMTVLSPNRETTPDDIQKIEAVFSLLGKVLVLPEKMMDAVTAVSGSGPAYVYTLIQAMTEGGVKMGIPRDKALLLTVQTVLGAAKMVAESGEEPVVLRGRVSSPGGTTIEAVHVLERAGFSGIVMDAVAAAAEKSQKLGRGKT